MYLRIFLFSWEGGDKPRGAEVSTVVLLDLCSWSRSEWDMA